MVEEIAIDDIRIGPRHRKDLGDIGSLANSITEIGLLHPIVISAAKALIAGHRRLEACKRLGLTRIPARIIPLVEIVKGELHENAVRKDFTPSEWVSIKDAIEPLEREAAKERLTHGGRGKRSGNFPDLLKGDTRDRVAGFVGVSAKTLEKAAAVVEAAEADPAVFNHVLEEMDRTGKVDRAFKQVVLKQTRDRQLREIEQYVPPPGTFSVIVVDPPWQYEKRSEDLTHRGITPYPSMTVDAIKAIDIPATEDCVLWLWVTNAHMRDAFEVLDVWSFEPKTILTWVKPKMGCGDWLRGQTEHCMLAVRGHPIVHLTNQTTVLYGNLRQHSRKPEEFYRLVESLCPAKDRRELFSRQKRDGWVTDSAEEHLFVAEQASGNAPRTNALPLGTMIG